MTDNQEASADIIAEMRRRIAVKMSDAWYTQEEWRKLCDRLEAAYRREAAFHAMTCEANERLREHLQVALDADGRERGDCAKLREALEAIISGYKNADLCDKNYGEWCHDSANVCVNVPLCKAIHEARAALAAPPRNCDKYTNYIDAMQAFEESVREQGKLGFINPYTEAFNWLFAPATEQEGGDK